MYSYSAYLQEVFGIDKNFIACLNEAEESCLQLFRKFDQRKDFNQAKVLKAFRNNGVSDYHLNGSTGYGYGDAGRDILEKIYRDIFKAQKALVRSQLVSGTHAIAVGLLGNLSAGDELVSATGKPYDTLMKIIGSKSEYGSLAQLGVKYTEIPLKNGADIDLEKLLNSLSERTKIVYFQRSRGYEWRRSFTLSSLAQAIREVKKQRPDIVCMVDNCYGEFVEHCEPIEMGADLAAGSLIKNPGGGLALSGGYLVGREELIRRSASRLTAPGIALEVGASLNFNRYALQGIFMAPSIVSEALKGATLAARFFESLGYPVLPQFSEERSDIIQAINLGSKDKMAAFCKGIQMAGPLDANVTPVPAALPGYEQDVIMAGGSFVQGSSIELSADGPLREPYAVYLQGGLSLAHIKLGLLMAAQQLITA